MPSHGTCNAGKALGTQFGASKKATLVVVRLHAITHLEVQAAFELIMKDIDDHPERRKKSVISMALAFKPVWDQKTVDGFRQLLTDLFAKDIPLISIAGNDDGDAMMMTTATTIATTIAMTMMMVAVMMVVVVIWKCWIPRMWTNIPV